MTQEGKDTKVKLAKNEDSKSDKKKFKKKENVQELMTRVGF